MSAPSFLFASYMRREGVGGRTVLICRLLESRPTLRTVLGLSVLLTQWLSINLELVRDSQALCQTGEGNSNPLQYSCLENLMDQGAWRATVHSITKSRTISSWLTTREGVGDKLGSASRLSPFFFPIPACILISAHSSALIYHLKVEAGEFDSQIKSRGGFVTENMFLFTLVRVTSFVSQTCGLFHPIVCSDAPLC